MRCRLVQPFDCWCFTAAAGLIGLFWGGLYWGAVCAARAGERRLWQVED